MEYRKLMAFGNSSFIVSIPKNWIKKNNLEKGEVLVIEERPHELIISSKKQKDQRQLKELVIDAKGKTAEILITEVTSAYLNNYNIITVKNTNKNKLPVKKIIQDLAGMEIIEETSDKVIAKDLLDLEEVSLNKITRRIDIILRSMIEDGVKLEKTESESIQERDTEVNRLCLLGLRSSRAAIENPSLLKLFEMNNLEVVISKELYIRLERIGDQVKRIARVIASKNLTKQEHSDFKDFYDKVSKYYLEVIALYYSNDREGALRLEGKTKELFVSIDENATKHSSVEYAHLVEHLKHIVSATSGILRSIMEKSL